MKKFALKFWTNKCNWVSLCVYSYRVLIVYRKRRTLALAFVENSPTNSSETDLLSRGLGRCDFSQLSPIRIRDVGFSFSRSFRAVRSSSFGSLTGKWASERWAADLFAEYRNAIRWIAIYRVAHEARRVFLLVETVGHIMWFAQRGQIDGSVAGGRSKSDEVIRVVRSMWHTLCLCLLCFFNFL